MDRVVIVTVYTQKGGVGKTTLSIELGNKLASDANNRVLLIDADSQASLTYSLLGRAPSPTDDSLYHQIINFNDMNKKVEPAKLEQVGYNKFLLPGNSNTSDLSEMVGFAEKNSSSNLSIFNIFTGRLYHAIQATCLKYNVTHVIIDTNPVKDVLNRRLIGFADFVVSPIRCDNLSKWAVTDWENLFLNCKEEIAKVCQSANCTAHKIPTISKAKFVGYVIQSEIEESFVDFYRQQAVKMGGQVYTDVDNVVKLF